MFKVLKPLIAAALIILVCEDASAQYEKPARPPLPPGMKYDTMRRKDANNWEFIQVRMPGMSNMPNKQLLSEGTLHNGVLEGGWVEYWETGSPRLVTYYTNGKKNGICITGDPTGSLEQMESYRDDKLEGPSRLYIPHTGMLLEETYYSEGLKHGQHTKWYQDHTLQEQANYVNGKLEGAAIWNYDDGKKSVEYNYHNGMLDGSAAVYFRSGMASEMGQYVNNMQSGHWKEFQQNGNLKEEGEYVNGEKDGIWKEYDEQGNFVKNIKYKKGVLQKK